MRSFLTRLVDAAARVVHLIPCLLICLACATPFASWRLEKGMTQDEVRALEGEPKSTWVPHIAGKPPKPGVVEEAWGYRYWLFNEIALYFEDAKLIRWKVLDRGSGYAYWPSWQQSDWQHSVAPFSARPSSAPKGPRQLIRHPPPARRERPVRPRGSGR